MLKISNKTKIIKIKIKTNKNKLIKYNNNIIIKITLKHQLHGGKAELYSEF